MEPLPGSGSLASRTAPGSRGADWVADGFRCFRRDWQTWLVISLLLSLASFVQVVPVIGTVVVFLLSPVVMGGLMAGLAGRDQGRPLQVDDMFRAFSTRAAPLMRIGLVSLVLNVVAVGIAMYFVDLVAVMDFLTRLAQTTDMMAAANNLTFALGLLTGVMVYIMLLVPITMLVWFAPALVVLEGESATAAMRHSFVGCARNMMPYLVYGLVGLVIFPLLLLCTLGLGVFVLLPVGVASIYSAYRDIFHRA